MLRLVPSGTSRFLQLWSLRNITPKMGQHVFVNPYAAGGYFGQYITIQKSGGIPETLAHGYSSESTQREVSNEYLHGKVWVIFKNMCALVLWTKLASALDELILKLQSCRMQNAMVNFYFSFGRPGR